MNPPPSIPDHELLRVIGRGSYGEVWLARNVMGVLRAVKLVYRSRFDHARPYEREFGGIQRYEPLSRTSDGLVQVLHVGRNDAAGCFYYVMELADDANDSTDVFVRAGEGLNQPVVRDTANYVPRTLRCDLERVRRLPVEECAEIGRSLASGLAQLHRHRLVHRDLKPSNVIFVDGRAKLADVGLVTGVDESRSFVGTEGFVPPEGPGRAPADLFALSRVLYQAATGLEPEHFPEIPPDWLEAPEARELIEFHEVLLKLGEGSVIRRYPSAVEVLADLALIQSGKSVRELRALERRVVWFRRLGAVAVLGLAAAGLAWLWARADARRERDNFSRVAVAERRARHELINTRLAQAHAERLAGGIGRRDAGLQALTNAASLEPDPEQLRALRSETVATLAQPGLRWLAAPAGMRHLDPMGVVCDSAQERSATWNRDGAIVVRHLEDGHELSRLPALSPAVDEILGFNESHRFLAVRQGEDRLIADLSRGVYCRTNRWATLAPPDRLWTADPDGTLRCEELPGAMTVQTLPVPAESAGALPWRRLSVTDSGHRLAAAGAEGHIVWWEVESGSVGGTFSVGGEVFSLAWSATGDRLAVGTEAGDVGVWAPPDPLVQWRTRVHAAAVRRLAFSPDGRVLSAASEGEVLKLLDAPSGRTIVGFAAVAWQQTFRRADNRLALIWRGGQPGFIELLPTVGLQVRRGARNAADEGALAFSADGRWLAMGTVATVDLWEQPGGTLATSLPARGLRSVAFGVDPPSLQWLDDSGAAFLPLGSTSKPWAETPVRDHSHAWTHLSLAAEGAVVLADAAGEKLVVRRPGAPERELGPHPFVRFSAIRPDGGIVASGSLTQPGVQLWDATSGQRLTTLPSGLNVRPAFSPRGSWLGLAGPTASLWRGPDWTAGPTLPTEPANTVAGTVAFNLDETLLAAVYGDHQVRLFRLPDAKPGLSLEAPGGARVLAVAFSPDGRQLAASTTEGELLLWDLPVLNTMLESLSLGE